MELSLAFTTEETMYLQWKKTQQQGIYFKKVYYSICTIQRSCYIIFQQYANVNPDGITVRPLKRYNIYH